MKIKFCIFYFFLFNGILVFGQAPEIEWEHSYGGSGGGDEARSIIEMSDGGYFIAGYSNSTDFDVTVNYGGFDYWLLKVDSIGNIEWQKSFGGSNSDQCRDAITTADGGYLVIGNSNSVDGDIDGNHGGYDYWAIKIDSSGNMEWQKSYGGSSADYAHSIIKTFDGNYILLGSSDSEDWDVSDPIGDRDIWLVKINPSGDILWDKSIGTFLEDEATDIVETISHEYFITGYIDEEWDYRIYKINVDGTIIWSKIYGGSDSDIPHTVINTPRGGCIIYGESYSDDGDVTGHHGYYGDYWVVELDSSGEWIWGKCFGGSGGEEGWLIDTINNNHFLLSGWSSTNNNGDVTGHHGIGAYGDYWIVEIDSIGNIIWEKSLGGTGSEEPYSFSQTLDQGLILAGWTYSTDGDISINYGGWDYWIVKLVKPCTEIFFYKDFDGDGYGDNLIDTLACEIPLGYVELGADCNDFDATVYPTAEEICNNIDDNCDGNIDEDIFYYTYFEDADNDDYGNLNSDSIACALPEGYVESNSDCDDTNPSIYPGAPEILNGLDDNCDGFIDEGLEINNALLSAIKIYPNPATDQLFIETSLEGDFEIEIFDARGRIVFNSKFNSSTNISLINFSSGIYFIKIISENSFAGINFVKE